jgi:hypothetical protein
MCSADGFVNAHRWVASAALAPRSAQSASRRGRAATSFSDAHSVNERVSAFSNLFSLNGIWCMRLHAVRAYKLPVRKCMDQVWYRSTLRRSFGALARCRIMTT